MKNKLKMIFITFILVASLLFCGCIIQNSSNQNDQSLGDEFVLFSYPPTDLDNVVFIIPLGNMKDEHVYPTDHQYYVASYYYELEDENVVDVYSPGDGVITQIEYHDYQTGSTTMEQDYRVVIKHTDMIYSYFIHIDNLSEKIAETVTGLTPQQHEDIKPVEVNIPVEAGEKIGTYKGTLDYNVVDYNIEIGIINIESYGTESFKLHIQDPFIYFNESIKSQLIDKCQRSTSPEGGTIDYDIYGKLVGTWFLENADGYEHMQGERDGLAFVYHNIDTDHVIVSIGLYENSPKQFGVKDISFDPADISIESGLTKLELVNYNYYYNGEYVSEPDSLMKGLELVNEEQVRAVLLVQLIDDQKLKIEVFPGATSEEISGFSEHYRIYTR